MKTTGKDIDFREARDIMLDAAEAVEIERILLENCTGRILAQDLVAAENVPAFDRSPYDGYAFRAKDAAEASYENPITLKILEEVAAGAVPTKVVTEGTAVKILTGAPIPQGADVVVMYEKTTFTEKEVILTEPVKTGKILYVQEKISGWETCWQKGEQ